MPVFLSIFLPLLALLCLLGSHRTNKRRRLIGNLPTSKTQGVFIGLVELKGTAECEAPVTSYLSEIPCVHYSWNVSERWQREVTEEYTDQEGNRRTRTRIESGWTTVASGGETAPFYLRDDTGVVLVRPDGAEVRPRRLFSDSCTPGDPLYYGKGPAGAIPNSTLMREFSESGIPLHDPIFVVGQARERTDIVAPELAHAREAPLYLLTVETEEQVMNRMGFSMHFVNILGLALAGGAGVAIAHLVGKMRGEWWPWAALGAGIYLAAWAVTWLVLVFNALIDVRNRMRQGWASLEVQLNRRHDLIPQLVQIVEAGRNHESDVQSALAELRGQASATSFQGGMHGVAGQVQILVERYPELKAQASFAQLQKALIETEQRIALARSYFNDVTTAYNTRLEIVPDGWIARLGGFSRQPLIDAEDFERAKVDVTFA